MILVSAMQHSDLIFVYTAKFIRQPYSEVTHGIFGVKPFLGNGTASCLTSGVAENLGFQFACHWKSRVKPEVHLITRGWLFPSSPTGECERYYVPGLLHVILITNSNNNQQ